MKLRPIGFWYGFIAFMPVYGAINGVARFENGTYTRGNHLSGFVAGLVFSCFLLVLTIVVKWGLKKIKKSG